MSNFEEKSLGRIKRLEREVERLKVKESPGTWLAWTPTLTGWTESLPAGGIYRYCKIGKLVILRIGMSAGTSNDTVASMTIPFSNFNTNVHGTIGYAMNAGTWLTGACRWNIPASGTSVNFYTDMASGAWTDSGAKRIYAVIIYEAA